MDLECTGERCWSCHQFIGPWLDDDELARRANAAALQYGHEVVISTHWALDQEAHRGQSNMGLCRLCDTIVSYHPETQDVYGGGVQQDGEWAGIADLVNAQCPKVPT